MKDGVNDHVATVLRSQKLAIQTWYDFGKACQRGDRAAADKFREILHDATDANLDAVEQACVLDPGCFVFGSTYGGS